MPIHWDTQSHDNDNDFVATNLFVFFLVDHSLMFVCGAENSEIYEIIVICGNVVIVS